MKYYFAPMEGITGYLFRNAHHAFFPHIDKYFTPFLSPNQTRKFHTREREDILPEHNRTLRLIPQILTNQADAFLWAAGELSGQGYREVNLNLGCPSATVVSKGKGAGFLGDPGGLEIFLDRIFSGTDLKISVKTRLGLEDPGEFPRILEIFNRFPLEELVIHPRVQADFYKRPVHWEAFREAAAGSRNPICYNGDLFQAPDVERFQEQFPEIRSVMLGRGLLANPGLAEELTGHGPVCKAAVRQFHDQLLNGYRARFSGDRPVLFKMKELWFYLGTLFEDSGAYQKAIRKAEKLSAYQAAVDALFCGCRLAWQPELPFACR